MLIILAIWEAEIRRIKISGQPGQGSCKTPSQREKLDMVAHAYYPRNSRKFKIGGL
jgi:hypothetical protein